ncbi:MAG: hypothetical protein JXR48_12355 [Candidatus Delongbacteria bacterium]|nr:hypothetical protein [Candidatus Delongbacteria bacterium]MBN2835744.1 hypothetical protein [Candidatus Delongbacteria bacterium]
MKKLVLMMMVLALLILVGCSSTKQEINKGAAYLMQKYERQFGEGLEKYDDALEKAMNITELLNSIDHNLSSLPQVVTDFQEFLPAAINQMENEMTALMAVSDKSSEEFKTRVQNFAKATVEELDKTKSAAETVKGNPGQVFKMLWDNFRKSGITVKLKIKDGKLATDIDFKYSDEFNKRIDKFKEDLAKLSMSDYFRDPRENFESKKKELQEKLELIFDPIIEIKNNGEQLISDSKELASMLKNLASSASSDFTGMNAMKAPKAVAALTDTAAELLKVPVKLVDITVKVVEITKQVIES